MHLNNVFERISEIVSFLSANYYICHEFTVKDISEELGIPIKVLRNDLAEMMQIAPFKENLIIGEDEFTEYTPEEMLQGECDDVIVQFEYLSFTGQKDLFLVPLSKVESPIVSRWFSGRDPLFKVKYSGEGATEAMKIKLDSIYEAIESGSALEYEYTNSKGETDKLVRCRPMLVRINSQQPADAKLIASNGVIFSIRGMENIRILKHSDHQDPDRGIKDDWDAIWHLPSQSGTRESLKQHVKLEIWDTTRNIMNKIKADTERRKNKKWSASEDGTLIYEDEVSGFDGFKTWVMGYGSNIKVIEPQWLAEEIQSEFEKMKRQYDTGEFED